MSVDLQPPELSFRRPFNKEVVQSLFIKNPQHEPVAFKVKTTAPKQYCVRPNSGRIEVGKEVEVQVLLQAMRDDPPPDFRCRDKFLVQSVPITADQEFNNVTQIWQEVEKNYKSSIQEKKIRVTYLAADPNAPSNTNTSYDQSLRSSSPPPYSSPSPDITHDAHPAPVGPVSVMESRPDNHPTTRDAVKDAFNPSTDTNATSLGQSASNAASSASYAVADQLAEAKAQIAALTAQIKESTQGKTYGEIATNAKDKVTAGVSNLQTTAQGPAGVPVQLAAGLCLLAFLLAYFLF